MPPFQNVSRFHYAHRSRCFVHVGDETAPVFLNQGDLIIVTRGAGHRISDPADAAAKSIDRVVEASGFTGEGTFVYGSETSGHETQLVCGHFTFDPEIRHILLDSLPNHICLRDYGKSTPDWPNDTLKIIGGEAGTETMGSDLIALKLSEIIYMQAIRAFMSNEGRARKGLAGFTDPHISRILQKIHKSPEHPWMVTELAQIAGLSRTAFSTRFDELLTQTPLAYMTAWHIQLARRLLIASRLAIIEIAERSGYRSEAASGRVFSHYFDKSPASYRRNAITRPTV